MPKQVTLQDFVPYGESIQWRIHDAYFASRGTAAWTTGEIPYYSTSNYATARMQVLVLARVVRELESARALAKDEPVYVLEVGSGLGQFAHNFIRAIDDGTGKEGKALGRRIRYLLSDYSENTVRQAAASPLLRGHVASGRVIPTLFDGRHPERLTDVSGRPLDVKVAAAIGNYVFCVLPVRMIRKDRGEFLEKWISVKVDRPDDEKADGVEGILREILDQATRPELMKDLTIEGDWRPTRLEKLLPSALHVETVRELLEPYDQATLAYHFAALDLLRALERHLKPGGVVLVNDYGSADRSDLRGADDVRPQHYGNSVSHAINFSIFDVFCRNAGLSCVRTDDPFRSVHSAVFGFKPELPEGLRDDVRELFLDESHGEDMLDFSTAARQYASRGEHARACRLYQRCLDLDPDSVEILYWLGEACVEGGFAEPARRYLERGRELDVERAWDFDFQLGRAYYRLERWHDAIQSYLVSLEKAPDPTTYSNLGVIHEERNDYKNAYLYYKKALALDPNYERAKTLIDGLKTKWAEVTLGENVEMRALRPGGLRAFETA